jgi:hypothetical protein
MTVIVTGVPRGGTTCVARIVDALGVTIVTDQPNSMDWMEMREQIIDGNWDAVGALMTERRPQPWGFKAPGVFGHLADNLDRFPFLRIIYVVRDPVANAQSVVTWHRGDAPPFQQTVVDIAEETVRAASLIPQWGVPCLFVSYEETMTRTSHVVSRIASFLGVPHLRSAEQEVVLDDPRYLPPVPK